MAAQHQTRPASSSSGSTYSPPASSFSRPLSTHPQLRLPLSHHGLPRGPTSPENSFSSRSQRYEPLSKTPSSRPSSSSTTSTTTTTTPKRYSSDPDEPSAARASHFFRLSVATAPPSPPVTPFSPGAFPSELEDDDDYEEADEDDDDERLVQCCPRCRCSLSVQPLTAQQQQQQQVQRARSMDEIPSPVRRQTSTRSMSGADRGGAVAAAADPAVQRGQTAPRPPAQPSGLAKFGKRIKARLGTRMGEGGGGGEVRRPEDGGARASRRVEYEEMEEVHWTEI
ncbi:hypothetical protein GTA08_BOTSDO09761 [Neofusicoccum parvum]|uniref:Uncharacterized protein n=1 Tax=Neofusicoccum parvum TaxID=310453 RepID=A0ACB5RS14_9PEZI|nr:hypothetical protein GTA08_BOTSDO09761 [Neofusicoccum parvum]